MPVAIDVERWTLDGVELNDPANGLLLRAVSFPPARQNPAWLDSPDADGALLLEPPRAGLREHTYRLELDPQADMDAALARVATLADKLIECARTRGGRPLVHAPANASKTATYWALHGQIDELPVVRDGEDAGWLQAAPVLTIRITCDPFADLPALANITDDFAANTIANYTFDAGVAGDVAITGGVLDAVGNLTAEKRLVHASSPWPLGDRQQTLKHTVGTTISGYKAGILLKRIDASNYLEAYVDDNGTNSRLRVDKIVAGVRTNLQSTNLAARLATSTGYWLRARIEGNTVVAEHWTAAPTVSGTATLAPAATVLAGADATLLGTGVTGRPGVSWIPQQTAATLDDLLVEPNVWRSSVPLVEGVVRGVPGNAPAKGLAILTDAAGKVRRFAELGAGADLTSPLILDSDSLTALGGAQATRSGAYDPDATGTNVISASVSGTVGAICATAPQPHVGSFRVRGRVYASLEGAQFRLAWQDKDGPWIANPWASPAVPGSLMDVDLGLVTLVAGTLGAQTWVGRIEAYNTAGGTVEVDELELIPVDDTYGIARSVATNLAGSPVAGDEFTGTTAGGVLNARTPPLGAAWATSGASGDFLFADDTFGELLTRQSTSASLRFGVLGSVLTDQELRVTARFLSFGGSVGALARFVDASNHLRLTLTSVVTSGRPPTALPVKLINTVGGVETVLDSKSIVGDPDGPSGVFVISLLVYATGYVNATVTSPVSGQVVTLTASDSALAAGGTLDDGKAGIVDAGHATANPTHSYDNVAVLLPPPEPVVINSGRDLRIGHDSVLRADSAGTRYGRPPSYRGRHFFLEPAGAIGRGTRVAARAHRNDLLSTAYDPLGDLLQLQVLYTPRVREAPR